MEDENPELSASEQLAGIGLIAAAVVLWYFCGGLCSAGLDFVIHSMESIANGLALALICLFLAALATHLIVEFAYAFGQRQQMLFGLLQTHRFVAKYHLQLFCFSVLCMCAYFVRYVR